MAPSRYRKTKINGRTVQMHRAIYEREIGPIPKGMLVHHIDENPRNNDPSNLLAMTHAEHSRLHNDKHPRVKACEACGVEYEPPASKRERSKSCSSACARALMARQVGSAKGTAKLTETQVALIRARVAVGERQKALCAEFGLSAPAMSALVNRKTWRHVV